MFKRKVTPAYDTLPSLGQQSNFDFSQKDIKDKQLLDVGCWTGQYISLAQGMAFCVGVDIEEKAISFAKKINPQAEFRIGSALELPFENDSFEVVTLWDVIEHLPKGTEPKVLSEIGRVLKKSGLLFISVPYTHIVAIMLDPAFFIEKHRHYSLNQLQRLLENADFKIENSSLNGGMYFIAYYWVQMFFKHVLKIATPDINFFKVRAQSELKTKGFSRILIKARLK